LREKSRHLSRSIGAALGAAAVTLLVACGGGGDSNQFANEAAGEYPVEVLSAQFKPSQIISRTYDLRLKVRNSGEETVPALNATIDLPGQDSTLAFSTRAEQEGVAAPQRPVWVLEEGYPKLSGTVGRGGAETANRRTYNFRELPPGEVADMIWRVTAVKDGDFEIRWQIAAGLGLDTTAVDAAGEQPTGLLPVTINAEPRLTKIDENGNVVPLSPAEQRVAEAQENN